MTPALRAPVRTAASTAVGPASKRTADVLRERILTATADGEFLGSESDLLEALDVSRPTLRQAARILEAEQLLTVRRGVNGGFFSRRPDAAGVAHMASIVLRSQGATHLDLARAAGSIYCTLVPLAAANPDAAARAEIRDLAEAMALNGRAPADRRAFTRALTALAGSPTFGLFLDVILDLSAMAPTVLVSEPDFDAILRAMTRDIGRVVGEGNPAKAFRVMTGYGKQMVSWVEENYPDLRMDARPKRTR